MRNTRSYRARDYPATLGLILVGLLIAGAMVFGIVNVTHTSRHSGCEVSGKDRTSGSNGHSDMRVYTSNCGVFQVKDSFLSWTWHSSDTYASIQIGHVYDFTTRGYRIPFFSKFPNIVHAEEVQ